MTAFARLAIDKYDHHRRQQNYATALSRVGGICRPSHHNCSPKVINSMRRTAIFLGAAVVIALALLVLMNRTAFNVTCGFGNGCTPESERAAGTGSGVIKPAAMEAPMSRTRSFLAL